MKYLRASSPVALTLALLSAIACSDGDETETSGDGDGDVLTGSGGVIITSSGGAPNGSGGMTTGSGGDASASGGMGGAGTGGAGTGGAGTGGAGTGGESTGGMGGEASGACEPFADFKAGNDGFGVYLGGAASAGTLSAPYSGSLTEGLVTASTGTGADGSSGFLHYAGTGFDSMAASTPGGIRFATDPIALCQDVSAATGLRFWAKGTSSAFSDWGLAANTMIVWLVADTATEGASQKDFRQTVTSEWAQYDVPFASFNGGYTADVVERVKFELPGGDFDISIDEVSFY